MPASFQLSDQPITWVMAGDSITQGVLHTYGARSWVEHFHERVRWQLDRFLDVVINSGMSGWTAPKVLAQFDHLIARYHPNVVHIALGTNDALGGLAGVATYREAMTQLITRSQALPSVSGVQVVLHTPVLITHGAQLSRGHLGAYAQAVRELADAHRCVLVDHEANWKQHFGAAEPVAWMDDHTHPNAVGHAQIAQHTLRTLGLGDVTDIHQR